jgi:hypothetical protein
MCLKDLFEAVVRKYKMESGRPIKLLLESWQGEVRAEMNAWGAVGIDRQGTWEIEFFFGIILN